MMSSGAWNNLNHALNWYQEHGFKFIDVPLLVRSEINRITFPDDDQQLKNHFSSLIGSGEQGFLQILPNLREDIKYVTLTPCFRLKDNARREYKYRTFYKVELGQYTKDKSSVFEKVDQMLDIAFKYFHQSYGKYASFFKERSPDDPNVIDINCVFEDKQIEVGSYGFRELSNKYFIFGTGLAEPRLSNFLMDNQRSGYHKEIIPKGIFGTVSKIEEEIREYKDAKQTNPIIAHCEISDIYGATMGLIENSDFPAKSYKDMSALTHKSFETGRRK